MFLCGNIGYEFSANSICKYLKSEGASVNPNIILDYLHALRAGYFIHEVRRYDLKGKKVFKQNAKYYVNDIGIRNSIIGFDEVMTNQIIENIVFMQLKSDGYEVYVGSLGDKEIDFVAIKNKQIKYIQVALTIGDKKTREREFGNLLKIEDNFEKIVISMDNLVSDYQGVRHVKLIDFLTAKAI
jgi:predicted AAA+ superfamily ATPase